MSLIAHIGGLSNNRQQKEAAYEVKLPIYRGPCNGSSLRLNKFYGWVVVVWPGVGGVPNAAADAVPVS